MICKECRVGSDCTYVQFVPALQSQLHSHLYVNKTLQKAIYVFMRLFLEMLWEKEGCNLSGGEMFPYHSEYFPPCQKSETNFFVLLHLLTKLSEEI